MSAVTGFYTPSGQGWRLAGSLVTLAHELAQAYGDQLTCLGTVGDVAHAAEAMGSDHNPFIRDPAEPSIGVVRAIDFGGPDSLLRSIRQQIWARYAASDQRVYVFGYAKGCSDNLINDWGLPFGTHVDAGDAGHLHVSVTQMNGYAPSPGGYVAAIDSAASWGFATLDPSGGGTPIPDPAPAEEDDMPKALHLTDLRDPEHPVTYIAPYDLSSKTRIVSATDEANFQILMTGANPIYEEHAMTPDQIDAIPNAGGVTVNIPAAPAPTVTFPSYTATFTPGAKTS